MPLPAYHSSNARRSMHAHIAHARTHTSIWKSKLLVAYIRPAGVLFNVAYRSIIGWIWTMKLMATIAAAAAAETVNGCQHWCCFGCAVVFTRKIKLMKLWDKAKTKQSNPLHVPNTLFGYLHHLNRCILRRSDWNEIHFSMPPEILGLLTKKLACIISSKINW